MQAYIEPIKFAIFVFPFLALGISTVFFIVQYRQYGRFILSKAIVLYSFVFYLLCAYFLVVLPLPPIQEVATYSGPIMELRLGHSLYSFLHETNLNIWYPSTYLPALKQSVFLEPLFNVILTLPFGIYLRYYFKKSFRETIFWTFLLSLFFEVTQLTGLYFIYPRSYRLFDVNDLLHNTLGGMIGYLLTPIFTYLLPTKDEMDERSYEKGQEVTYIRRLVAWGIDWAVLSLISILVSIGFRLLTGNYTIDVSENILYYFVQVFLYFILLPSLTDGQTLGKKLVRIRLVEENGRKVSFKSMLQRYGLLYLVYFALGKINLWIAPTIQSDNQWQMLTALGISVIIWVLQLMFVTNISWSILRKKRRLFYENISHTHTISTIKAKTS